VIKRFFKNPAKTISVQTFRYALAGCAAYTVDYSALVILTKFFGVYYLTSAAVAFALGAVTSYILNISWVFDKRTFKDRRLEGAIFFSIAIIGISLNHYCMLFFTESVKLHYLISKFISTIAVAAMNFFARKFILFR
jgi:putative flippase GtrA